MTYSVSYFDIKTFESTAFLPLFVAELETHLVSSRTRLSRMSKEACLLLQQFYGEDSNIPYGLVLNFISADRCSNVGLFILEK